MTVSWTDAFATRIHEIKPSAIRAMARHLGKPGVISFASGSPNAELFPFDAIAAATQEILGNPTQARQALQYGPSEGYPPLREFIAEVLSRDGGPVAASEVIVTSGSQQALEFIGKTFIDDGDRVIVSSPTYSGALQAFGLFRPAYVSVPLTAEGLDLARLETEFRQGAKFFYIMPDHGNPTGTTIPLAQRREIVRLARQYKVPLIEDQAYDQLQLSGERQRTLLSLDRSESGGDPVVIYLGTFSKSLTPGLRVGWIVAPEAVIAKLVSVKQASDLNSGMLNQMIVNAVARRILDAHVPILRDGYRARRDRMLAALTRHMPKGLSWTEPQGGMFVWLTLPTSMDADDLQRVAFEKAKIIFVPGASFHADGTGKNTLRLSYSMTSEAEIDGGIARLAGVIAEMIGEGRAVSVQG
jgi:DNA-binding transcriptional MocR family regulator